MYEGQVLSWFCYKIYEKCMMPSLKLFLDDRTMSAAQQASGQLLTCFVFFLLRLPRTPDWANIWYLLLLLLRSHFSHAQFFATQWTVACQAPLSMGFSQQEYWSGLPCPPPGDRPNPGIKHASHGLLHCRQILYCWATGKAQIYNGEQQISACSDWNQGRVCCIRSVT